MQSEAPKLASNKYFSPQELNDLARVGKQPLPGVRKASANRIATTKNASQATSQSVAGNRALVVREKGALKKIEKTKTINYSESSANFEGGGG